MSTIYEDTRQQKGKHAKKHEWFKAHGVELVRRKLDAGDYMRDGSNITVDTKASVAEIAGNIASEHKRFKAECERARNAGLRLVVLIENTQNITDVSDVYRWVNTHCVTCHIRTTAKCRPRSSGKCPRHKTNKPIQGDRLAAAMSTMQRKYGVRFEFCKPDETAQRICELLGVTYEQDADGGTQAARAGVQDAPD